MFPFQRCMSDLSCAYILELDEVWAVWGRQWVAVGIY